MTNGENGEAVNAPSPDNEDTIAADSIFDADGALTRDFLLEREFCCENGCKNCPYGFRRADAAGG